MMADIKIQQLTRLQGTQGVIRWTLDDGHIRASPYHFHVVKVNFKIKNISP